MKKLLLTLSVLLLITGCSVESSAKVTEPETPEEDKEISFTGEFYVSELKYKQHNYSSKSITYLLIFGLDYDVKNLVEGINYIASCKCYLDNKFLCSPSYQIDTLKPASSSERYIYGWEIELPFTSEALLLSSDDENLRTQYKIEDLNISLTFTSFHVF